jgi:hypothetical protein
MLRRREFLRMIRQGLKNLEPKFAFENFPSGAAISKARSRIGDDVPETPAGKIPETRRPA